MFFKLLKLKGALCLFFFIGISTLKGQEILWKGKELQSGNHKTIDGEITIRTSEDTIRATKATLYNKPKRAVLKGNLSMVRKDARVTGDSAIYFPTTKLVEVRGNGKIQTTEGDLYAENFYYDMNTKILHSKTPTRGTANGISFKGQQSYLYPGTKNMKLIGKAEWENDTLKGIADTVFLDKTSGLLKMSRNARILYKKKKDMVSGSYLELDLNQNKISRIEGSEIRRDDLVLKASKINQKGENYQLQGSVFVSSKDTMVWSKAESGEIRKDGMDLMGKTKTRIMDKEGNEIFIYAPFLQSGKEKEVETTSFYKPTHIRGQFDGFADSIYVEKNPGFRRILLFRNAHLQNDSLYLEADTLEIYKDSLLEIIRAKRNARMFMITQPRRLNTITGAFIQLTKSKNQSDLFASGETESYLWNDEKSNVGLNHTVSPTQTAQIVNQKISRVRTRGNTASSFSPARKVDYAFQDLAARNIKETMASDSILPGLKPIRFFLNKPSKRP